MGLLRYSNIQQMQENNSTGEPTKIKTKHYINENIVLPPFDMIKIQQN
jgi:hypothetical protein